MLFLRRELCLRMGFSWFDLVVISVLVSCSVFVLLVGFTGFDSSPWFSVNSVVYTIYVCVFVLLFGVACYG